MTTDPDVRLLEGLRAGDSTAQEAFFDRYVKGIRAFVRRCLVKADHDADEITVDTFYRCFRSISAFEGRSSIRVWLVGIARRAAADHHRSRRRVPRPVSSLESAQAIGAGLDHVGGSRSASTGPLASVLRTEKRERLRHQMESLRTEHREVIVLRLVTGLSNRETAEAMDRSGDAVKMLLYRALESLHRRLNADPYFRDG